MNPQLFLSLWSFRKELKYVALAFLSILLVPIMGVILITRVGINIISDKLVDSNAVTNAINIKDPTSGEIIKNHLS
jgi:hypothetical protein